jgi:hypothetical protein
VSRARSKSRASAVIAGSPPGTVADASSSWPSAARTLSRYVFPRSSAEPGIWKR